MAISVGSKMPAGTLKVVTADGPKDVPAEEFFKGRKVVLFAVPGAFTPTCSEQHLPGFVSKSGDIKAKGVDEIACMAVNDHFVLKAWSAARGVGDSVTMIADGAATYTKALGLDVDLSTPGLGVRSRRYAMIVDDGKVAALKIEEKPGQIAESGADQILAAL
ncbi:MAG: peroxiredoxin [Acetobacterales bacterium]